MSNEAQCVMIALQVLMLACMPNVFNVSHVACRSSRPMHRDGGRGRRNRWLLTPRMSKQTLKTNPKGLQPPQSISHHAHCFRLLTHPSMTLLWWTRLQTRNGFLAKLQHKGLDRPGGICPTRQSTKARPLCTILNQSITKGLSALFGGGLWCHL